MLLFFALVCANFAHAEDNTVTLSRRVEVRECATPKRCGEWRSLGEEPAVLKLSPFHKSNHSGFDGWSRQSLKTHHTTIKTEIHFMRHEGTGPYKYFLYLMIRTGQRQGRTLGWDLHELTELHERALVDKRAGKLQARLIVGP